MLFDMPPTEFDQPRLPFADPRHPEADRVRLAEQCVRVLDALWQRPQTNRELSQIGLRFGARVKEIREAGYEIKVERLGGGLFLYTLVK